MTRFSFKDIVLREGFYACTELGSSKRGVLIRCSAGGAVYVCLFNGSGWFSIDRVFDNILKPTEEEIELAVLQCEPNLEEFVRSLIEMPDSKIFSELNYAVRGVISRYGDPLCV